MRKLGVPAPRQVYLDYHATTPVDPRVLERDAAVSSRSTFGNPASASHAVGLAGAGGGRGRRGGQVAAAHRRVRPRDHLHERRDRVEQLRDARRRGARAGRPAAHRRLGDRAQVRARMREAARASGWRVSARCRCIATGGVDLDALGRGRDRRDGRSSA